MSSSVKLSWTLRLCLAIHRFIRNASCRSNGTVNRRLLNFFDPKQSPSATPQSGVATSDVTVDASRNLWFRLFVPTNIPQGAVEHGSLPIIVYFHGGGFVFCSANSFIYDKWCRWLSTELQAIIVSVNYRLAPEHKFPAQYEDGMDALQFLDDHLDQLPAKANPNWCFLAGDSAGGNLAHHVAVQAGEIDFRRLKILGLVALQPFFGGEDRTESEIKNSGKNPILSLDLTDWYWRSFLPSGSDRNHPDVNVFGPKSSGNVIPDRFPATLVLIGGVDILKEWQKKYGEGLKKAGKEVEMVEHPNAFHGSYMITEFPEYSLIPKEIGDFMQHQIKMDSQ